MRDLISNVFDVDCFSLIYENIFGKKDKVSKRWKNLMGSYPLFVKKYKVKGIFLPKTKKCVTIAGMYFFWFLSELKHSRTKEMLKLFLSEEQGISTIENFLLYETEQSSCIFREITGVCGELEELLSTEAFNRSLVSLIEDYTLVPINTETGIIWTVNKEDSDLSELESVLLEYSGWLDYNELKKLH